MDAHEGFVASTLYPGYSADFHDNKHHIVVRLLSFKVNFLTEAILFQLGSSFVTIPRIAMRRSYVNFYQHNYLYAWIGGRVCFDVES